jgi:hypothetical protein
MPSMSTKLRKWYCAVLLSTAVVWRLIFVALSNASWRGVGELLLELLIGVIWPLLPYLLLAVLLVHIKTRGMLVVVTAVMIAMEAVEANAIWYPKGSTAALAMLFIPFWQLVIVVPGAALLDAFYRWGRGGFRLGWREFESVDKRSNGHDAPDSR